MQSYFFHYGELHLHPHIPYLVFLPTLDSFCHMCHFDMQAFHRESRGDRPIPSVLDKILKAFHLSPVIFKGEGRAVMVVKLSLE
jgi:hypothetical protein